MRFECDSFFEDVIWCPWALHIFIEINIFIDQKTEISLSMLYFSQVFPHYMTNVDLKVTNEFAC